MSCITAKFPTQRDVEEPLFRLFGFGVQSFPLFETVHHAFIHHATHYPGDIALVDLSSNTGSPREITYGELLCQSQFITRKLQLHGVKPEKLQGYGKRTTRRDIYLEMVD